MIICNNTMVFDNLPWQYRGILWSNLGYTDQIPWYFSLKVFKAPWNAVWASVSECWLVMIRSGCLSAQTLLCNYSPSFLFLSLRTFQCLKVSRAFTSAFSLYHCWTSALHDALGSDKQQISLGLLLCLS